MRKQADMSDFIGAQFFFDKMTNRSMKEYAMTGEVESHILVLTNGSDDEGAKKVVGTDINNAFDKDGIEFLAAMLAHAAKKLGFINKIKESGAEIVAVYEAYLIKANEDKEHDTLLTVHTYRDITIKRTFVAVRNNMTVKENGVNYELEFSEIED